MTTVLRHAEDIIIVYLSESQGSDITPEQYNPGKDSSSGDITVGT